MSSGVIDRSGQTFGRLTLLKRVSTGDGRSRYLCKCLCGEEKLILASSIVGGKTKSCGCLRAELTSKSRRSHGYSNKRIYKIWTNMKSRCLNPSTQAYQHYGGRNILIHDQWLEFDCFKQWAEANGYQEDLTIERIDVNGNYEPSNCCWIERAFQSRNTRATTYFTLSGEKRPLIEWCEMFRVDLNCAHKRLYANQEPFKISEIYTSLKENII